MTIQNQFIESFREICWMNLHERLLIWKRRFVVFVVNLWYQRSWRSCWQDLRCSPQNFIVVWPWGPPKSIKPATRLLHRRTAEFRKMWNNWGSVLSAWDQVKQRHARKIPARKTWTQLLIWLLKDTCCVKSCYFKSMAFSVLQAGHSGAVCSLLTEKRYKKVGFQSLSNI